VHEWTGNKERVHLVLSNGRAKRAGAWELNISTAGASIRSLLGRMVKLGRAIREGKAKDDRLLGGWYEANDPKCELDLSDPMCCVAAIRQANPAADDFLDVESIAARYPRSPSMSSDAIT
jgi:phage terminase large subunit-like protein